MVEEQQLLGVILVVEIALLVDRWKSGRERDL